MKKILKLISTVAIKVIVATVISGNAQAHDHDLVIISSPENSEQLQVEDVARIFLGKMKRYPNGEEVEPLDIDPSHPSYAEFTRLVLKKSPSQLRAYWAKRIFTGKGKPPRIISSVNELRTLVSQGQRYLGYLYKEDVDDTVRLMIVVK